MKGKITCAILSLATGILISVYVIDPLIYNFTEYPCPANQNYENLCIQYKTILYIVPPIISMVGLISFFKKIGVIH